MNKFTLGAMSGMSVLALGAGILAQTAGAQSGSSSSMPKPPDLPALTQACVQAMVGLQDAKLRNFDAQSSERKKHLQEKRNALAKVASITDDAQRQAAMEQMHEEMRAAKDAERPEPPVEIRTALEAVRAACGDLHHRGGFLGPMHGPGFGKGRGGHRGMMMKRGWMMHPQDLAPATES